MSLYASFDNPLLEIHNGECAAIIAENAAAWGGAFDLAFLDPPFNIGEGYADHDDRMPADDFELMIDSSLYHHCNCLRPGGVMVVHVPDSMVYLILNRLPSALQRIDWVIWHYRFGQCQRSKFISSKCHALIFRKGSAPHTFNAEDILVESARVGYGDSRIADSVNGGSRVPFDVWTEFPRLQGNNLERSQFAAPHPNQLPELYLARFIKAYTNPGDYVIDGFGGTGTTITVAGALGRNCVTIEKSASYCEDIANRVKSGAIRV